VSLDLTDTLKTLRIERVQVQQELTKLDKTIAVLRELAAPSSTPNGHLTNRTMSAAARRKIGRAQKARWAKVRQAKAAKD